MIEKKHIIAIDFILVVGTLFALFGIFGYATPYVIAPIDDYSTTETVVLFSFEKAERILIDDNLDFSSPMTIEVEDDIAVSLEPGEYYWKVEGLLTSEVRSLTIESQVDLRLRETDDAFEVVNAGNTRLNVDIYEHGKLTGNVILEKAAEKEVSGEKFVGRQDE